MAKKPKTIWLVWDYQEYEPSTLLATSASERNARRWVFRYIRDNVATATEDLRNYWNFTWYDGFPSSLSIKIVESDLV